MLTRCNRLAGKADDLVVALDSIAGVQGFGGYLVPWRNQAFGGDIFQFGTADKLGTRYHDVVCWVESYVGGHECDL